MLKRLFAIAALLLLPAIAAFPASAQAPAPVRTPQTIAVTVTLTVTTGSAYASGNVIGTGKLQLANAVRAAGIGGIIQSVAVIDKSANDQPYDFIPFCADPSGTTFTDKAAVAVVAADILKVCGPAISVSGIVKGAASTNGVIGSAGLGYPFKLASGTTLFGVLVTRGTPTFAGASDLTLLVTILPD